MRDPSNEAPLAEVIRTLNSEDFLPSLESWLHAQLRHDNITILAYFGRKAPRLLMSNSSNPKVHKNFDAIYLAGAYVLDPYFDLHMQNAVQGCYQLSEIAPDQFNRNRYFNEYYRGTTLIDEIAFVSRPTPNMSIHVCLGRDESSKTRFSGRELSKAKDLAPVVVALSEKQWSDLSAPDEAENDTSPQSVVRLIKAAHDVALTPRQTEVAMLILRGHSSVSIGLRLGISSQTVKVFRKQLYQRCKITSQAELFSMFLPVIGVEKAVG